MEKRTGLRRLHCEQYPDDNPDRCLLMWSPAQDIADGTLDEYITKAYKDCGFNEEQALGFLFWYKYDLQKAMRDMDEFKPYPEEWNSEDKILFEQAHNIYGKNFRQIRQVFPEKTIGDLVRYYYLWKATRSNKSLLDDQSCKYSRKKGTWECLVTDEISDQQEMNCDSETKEVSEGGSETLDASCSNCGLTTSQLHSTSKGLICSSCFSHLTGKIDLRTKMSSSCQPQPLIYKIRKPPRGIYIDLNDLTAIANRSRQRGEDIFKNMDYEIVYLKRQVRINVQITSTLKFKVDEGIEGFRPPSNNHIDSQWTNDELYLAIQGIRKYGLDFEAIAEVIGNKTEAHVRTFFINYQKFFNLDAVLRDYEADQSQDIQVITID